MSKLYASFILLYPFLDRVGFSLIIGEDQQSSMNFQYKYYNYRPPVLAKPTVIDFC